MSKIVKTTAAGGAGFLAGLLFEKGLESITDFDFVDGLFSPERPDLGSPSGEPGLGGSCGTGTLSRCSARIPDITEAEWRQFKEMNPKTGEWLEKPLKICSMVPALSFLTKVRDWPEAAADQISSHQTWLYALSQLH